MSKRLLTSSALSALSCPRRYYYSYEAGIKKDVDTQPLRMGSAIHEGLDKGMDAAVRLYDVYPEWCVDDEQRQEWDIERARVVALLQGYLSYWRGGLSIIESEKEFCIPLRRPGGRPSRNFFLAGKIDKIVRDPHGRISVMEHKTTSDKIDFQSCYWDRLRMDHQISIYMIAARELGHDAEAIYYDVIKKPQIKPRIKDRKTKERESISEYAARLLNDISENPTKYYARREIPRIRADIEEQRNDLWSAAKAILSMRKHGFYRNTKECFSPWRCTYFDLCACGWKEGDRLPIGYIYGKRNPELEVYGEEE